MIHKRSHKDYIHTGLIYIAGLISFTLIAMIAEPIEDKAVGLRLPDAYKKEIQEKPVPPIFFKHEAFNALDVSARAYVVYDIVDKRIVASKNENLPLPLASLTKVMTALTALSMAPPETLVAINANSKLRGYYDLGLQENQGWRLDELLKYSLTFSSNDGMNAIANYFGKDLFVSQMNVFAKSIGKTFAFSDPAGLDNGIQLGGLGSAYDVALMMTEARKKFPNILDATTHTRTNVMTEQGAVRGIPNTNQDVANILGIEASKTGFTDLAGGNLAIITDISLGRPVAIIVLGSTREGRFKDAETIYKALLQSLK
ncbi:MAG: hypothetical protein QG653_481 [Patescibacteria group bacterium]|nr:hypothetical protein [Patescibacteria group bacterium]